MTISPIDVQKALNFLSSLGRDVTEPGLPDDFDDEAVAAFARGQGVDVAGPAVGEAFRLMMLARRLAGRGSGPGAPRPQPPAGPE